MAENKLFPAIATIVGTTIGTGYLGIPYVIARAGFSIGLIYIILVALFVLLINLYLGEVILRTKGNHQLVGYAEKYLGKKGKFFVFLAMIFGIYAALLAHLIVEGRSLSYLIFENYNFAIVFSLIFWLILLNLTYIGLRALKKYEKEAIVLVIFLVALIFFIFIDKIKTENLSYIGEEIFSPFGVILFSLLSFSAMPEVERILKGQEKLMKKVIFISILIPFFIYFLFTIVTVGVFGRNINEIATISLGRFFTILGIITISMSSFALSIALRDMFRFDLKLGRFKGWLLASFVPLFLFLIFYYFNLLSYVKILAVSGIVSGGTLGIITLLMNIKAKKLGNRKPEYSTKINWLIIFVLALIFLAAVILQIFY